MKVPKQYLLIIAGLVWAAAGFNILRIGLLSAHGTWTPGTMGVALGVYLLFHNGVFRRMVKKHTRRISAYKAPRVHMLHFFDKTAYIMMAGMMTLGIGLRAFGLLPERCIAMFYTGLGFALLVAGEGFVRRFFMGEARG